MVNTRIVTSTAAGLSVLFLATGCSVLGGTATVVTPDDEIRAEACRVIVTELASAGLSFGELIPADLSQVDGALLADAQMRGSEILEGAADKAAETRVGDVLDQTSLAMGELSEVVEAAAAGDAAALLASSGPLSRLVGVATSCATTSISDVQSR